MARPGRAELQRRFNHLEQLLPAKLDAARVRPAALPALLDAALDHAALAHATGAPNEAIRRSLSLCADAGIAILMTLRSGAREIQYRLDGERLEARSEPLAEPGPARAWSVAFNAAQIIADDASLLALSDVPTTLLRHSAPAHITPLFSALAAIHTRGKLPRALLTWILTLTEPHKMRAELHAEALHLDIPVLALLAHIHEHDEDGFSRALDRALERHRSWFDGLDTWPSHAAMAWRIASVTTMAERRGLLIKVDHPDLPLDLIRGV